MFKDVKDPGILAAISLFARALMVSHASTVKLGAFPTFHPRNAHNVVTKVDNLM